MGAFVKSHCGLVPHGDSDDLISGPESGLSRRAPWFNLADDVGNEGANSNGPYFESFAYGSGNFLGQNLPLTFNLQDEVLIGTETDAYFQFLPSGDRVTVYGYDDVQRLQASLLGRRSLLDAANHGRLSQVLSNRNPPHEIGGDQDKSQNNIHGRSCYSYQENDAFWNEP